MTWKDTLICVLIICGSLCIGMLAEEVKETRKDLKVWKQVSQNYENELIRFGHAKRVGKTFLWLPETDGQIVFKDGLVEGTTGCNAQTTGENSVAVTGSNNTIFTVGKESK